MKSSRLKALQTVISRERIKLKPQEKIVSDYFGSMVYNIQTMKKTLPESAYNAVEEAIHKGKKINIDIANLVAAGMKSWAMERGTTHVCHWFQPLTGLSAEKHDSFIEPYHDGTVMEQFSGKLLVQQEPDASSFPSGGLRQTFEARGYTAWDPSSPAFIMESGGAKTLFIPSIFISYSSEALDKKTPLLKSIEILNIAATNICKYFDKNVNSVQATLGAEQEYFLIDKAFFNARPDLIASGRTVLGAEAVKGQQLEDHYFGSIKERVFTFMNDFEREAYLLGIPLKTRHNEVAPHQFECAPIFEEANIAVDHNVLLMSVMKKVAERHDLAILFHEKPFKGVNGSGKHNNWSLSTDTGKNLLSPGNSPQENLQFLLFLTSITKAVYQYSDLLRAAIASSGNDHRLGANEAPPAIISVFLGEQLTGILNNIENGIVNEDSNARQMSFGISKIPDLTKDNTDRNRTSPFAFTGNKFEFRAVGSTANNANPITTLNTIVTKILEETKVEIEKRIGSGLDKKSVILSIIKEHYSNSKKVCFEGDGYSEEWVVEAEKRGLPNVKSSPKAFEALIKKRSIDLFEGLGIFTKRELESRFNIKIERFVKDINIEANILINLVRTKIVPTILEYQNKIIKNIKLGKEIQANFSTVAQETILNRTNELLIQVVSHNDILEELLVKAKKQKSMLEEAIYVDETVRVEMKKVRIAVDQLEDMTDDEIWPLPKYSEMLFLL
jgi:glutamine synthetase